MDVKSVKKDFPIFERQINGRPLVYLDSASTSQKPRVVLEALQHYYTTMNANIHRGIHTMAEEATLAYESVREHVARFINARTSSEIIFTRNTTEAINLVAYSWGEHNLNEGDEIVVSILEHHSNFVPWQQLCKRKKAVFRVMPVDENGLIQPNTLEKYITKKTKLVAITQMSNVLGTIIPLEPIIKAAHQNGAIVLVDGAQSVPHMGVDVQKLDCDFLAFSGHKMFGPTGVGVLYGKKALLEAMPPFLFGGDMIKEVHVAETTWNDIPWKFEAGTPNIADVIAFGKALEYFNDIGIENISRHEQHLLAYAREKLAMLPGIIFYGPQNHGMSGGILSFNIPTVHAHDVAAILNEEGIAIRAGHHCAQPLMEALKVAATARLSFYVYNDEADIDRTFEALKKVYNIFKPEKHGHLRRNNPCSGGNLRFPPGTPRQASEPPSPSHIFNREPTRPA